MDYHGTLWVLSWSVEEGGERPAGEEETGRRREDRAPSPEGNVPELGHILPRIVPSLGYVFPSRRRDVDG